MINTAREGRGHEGLGQAGKGDGGIGACCEARHFLSRRLEVSVQIAFPWILPELRGLYAIMCE